MSSLPNRDELLRDVIPHREKWKPRPADIVPEPVGPGEESVWEYPRPPIVEERGERVELRFAGKTIAATSRPIRVIETAGAPVYYLPPEDVSTCHLVRAAPVSVCEWKGAAIYYDLVVGERRSAHAAFAYPEPLDDLGQGYTAIAGWFGFYPGRVDTALLNGEIVRPQPGDVYAGWVTDNIKGPIKGAPGTEHW